MSPRPPFPDLPPLPPSPIKGVRDLIRQGRQQVEKARDSIRSIADDLRGGATTEPTKGVREKVREKSPISPTPDRVAQGTACELCSSEHFAQTSGDLAEALRFARSEGVMHPEVIKRVEHARQELNTMERYDLSPAEIRRLSGPERELANWALQKSRNLRHMINRVITTKKVSDLEAAAAEAETTAHEFTRRLWEIPPSPQECPECETLQELREYIEKRRQSHTTTKMLTR